ncbi:cyclic nucleotide-binding domain-containing protein [Chlorogloeopsis sp. ULAP01]|uniref:cyclic nucleotide-binding domain-containing protein n=1 Tax=Chlorogloeopsis sp. ULAP01 TaxID=3056483 RepID=UPI0025AA9FF7|nr:cyclic nucleotide-binding domain-containing protein [Chlorogloeopsis sp. ULAP01]MDM9384721.1 cyclic nucleotide-binding domain-containing protein [Chlorogloeopsis sp. ULAP01]
MTSNTSTFEEFLASISPFDRLEGGVIERMAAKLEPLRYRMGQAILVKETLPARIAILHTGQARLLGYAPGAAAPETLQLLKPGEILGWTSLVRGVACETAIACDETLCLTLKATDFLALLEEDEEVRRWGDREKELLRDNAQVGRLRSGENNFTPSPHHHSLSISATTVA